MNLLQNLSGSSLARTDSHPIHENLASRHTQTTIEINILGGCDNKYIPHFSGDLLEPPLGGYSGSLGPSEPLP